jgi:hypothetical protein
LLTAPVSHIVAEHTEQRRLDATIYTGPNICYDEGCDVVREGRVCNIQIFEQGASDRVVSIADEEHGIARASPMTHGHVAKEFKASTATSILFPFVP